MKIAYLVFAYRNPELLRREIEALSTPDSFFYIHIDKKSNVNDFSGIRGSNIFFLENRVCVYWAEFSGVLAILALIDRALKSPQVCDYLVLLSGSEYPLRSKNYIHNFFQKNSGQEFMDLIAMPNNAAGKPLSHINTFRVQSRHPYLRLVVRILSKMGIVRRDYRKYLGGLAPYGGHTWWALTREACQYIVDFAAQNPQIRSFFENVPQPEEMFFHTILGNSKFKARVRRNLLFEDWSAGGCRPEMINNEHVARFEAEDKVQISDVWGSGEVLFARKYGDENLKVVDRIDAMIRKKDGDNSRDCHCCMSEGSSEQQTLT